MTSNDNRFSSIEIRRVGRQDEAAERVDPILDQKRADDEIVFGERVLIARLKSCAFAECHIAMRSIGVAIAILPDQ